MAKTKSNEDKDANQLKENLVKIVSSIKSLQSNLIQLQALVNNEENRLNSLKEEYNKKSQELLECQINEALQHTIPYNTELPSQLMEECQKENLGVISHKEIPD